MAISISLPTFVDKEILTAEKMNSFVTSLNNVFTEGFSAADLSWPLVAEGALDMGTGGAAYSILGGNSIADVTIATGYASLAAAIVAAGAGGAIFIPPGTTFSLTSADTITASNVALFGAGPSSVIKASGAPAALIDVGNGATLLHRFTLSNLTIHGNDICDGVSINYVNDVIVQNVHFTNCNGNALTISNGGTDGRLCYRVSISGCTFDAGSNGNDIFIADAQHVQISNCSFYDPDNIGISGIAGSDAAYLRDIAIANCTFSTSDDCAISFVGTGSATQQHISITGCTIRSPGVNGIIVGDADLFNYCVISDNTIGISSGTGIILGSYLAVISGNTIETAGVGIDLLASGNSVVSGNEIYGDGGDVGVDCSGIGSGISITGNNIQNVSADISRGTTAPEMSGNTGAAVQNFGGQQGVFYATIYSRATIGSATDTVDTYPANFFQTGDVVDLLAIMSHNNADTDPSSVTLKIDGSAIAIGEVGDPDGDGLLYGKIIFTGATTIATLGGGASGNNIPYRTSAQYATYTIDTTAALTLSVTIDIADSGDVSVSGLSTKYSRVEIV